MMTPIRLRGWIRKYGEAGRLMVAAYFAGCWLWQKRLYVAPAMLLLLYAGLALLRPHQKPRIPPTPPPVVAVAPAPPEPQPEEKSSPAKDKQTQTLIVHEGRDIWRIEIWCVQGDIEKGEYVKFYRNAHLVRKVSAEEMGGCLLKATKPSFRTRFPVIGFSATTFQPRPLAFWIYTIQHGKLILMSEINGQHGGPIFRDYDGDGKPEWVFDDYDWYTYYEHDPQYFLVYKEKANGTLKFWRRLPNPKQRNLPANLGQNHLPDSTQ